MLKILQKANTDFGKIMIIEDRIKDVALGLDGIQADRMWKTAEKMRRNRLKQRRQ